MEPTGASGTADDEADGQPAHEPDPHDPEEAAALVADELVADRGHPSSDDGVFETAEQAARDVEKDEDAE
jgi:hypothetical protein